MMRQSSMGDSYNPGLVVDVPFAQGTLVMGLSAAQPAHTNDIIALLQALSQPYSCILKRLQEIETLLGQLQEARGELHEV